MIIPKAIIATSYVPCTRAYYIFLKLIMYVRCKFVFASLSLFYHTTVEELTCREHGINWDILLSGSFKRMIEDILNSNGGRGARGRSAQSSTVLSILPVQDNV